MGEMCPESPLPGSCVCDNLMRRRYETHFETVKSHSLQSTEKHVRFHQINFETVQLIIAKCR